MCTARERPRLAFVEQRRLKQKHTPDGFLSPYLPFRKALIQRTARERPRLPLRREVDFCPTGAKRQKERYTEGVRKQSDIRTRTCGRQRLAASLHPPPEALESQTPQREPRRLRRNRTALLLCIISSAKIFPVSAKSVALRFYKSYNKK